MKVYRLRSIDKLLNEEYPELMDQLIYCAPSSDFNDPLEGQLELLFQGDSVVWENLFRHFLLCMTHQVEVATLHRAEDPEDSKKFFNRDFPIFISESDLPTDSYRNLFNSIKERFFAWDEIGALIEYLGNRKTPLYAEQILAFFSAIALAALESILHCHEEAGLQPQDILKVLQDNPHRIKIPDFRSAAEEDINILMEFSAKIIEQNNIISYCTLGEKAGLLTWGYFFSKFPHDYLAHLQELVYPNWYAASFMDDFPSNMSLWSHYADGHKGICLVFHPEQLKPLEKVIYSNEMMQVDFFKHLWRQSGFIVAKEWYTNKDGQQSVLLSEIPPTREAHSEYWGKYAKLKTTKREDWRTENECRLLLDDSFYDYSDASNRVLKYDFRALEGIVFGIRTPIEVKAEMIKIIHAKCKETDRKNFSFYQARFDKKKHTVIYDELSLLSFRPHT